LESPLRRNAWILLAITLVWLAGPPARPLGAEPGGRDSLGAKSRAVPQAAAAENSAKFRLHKFEQPIGEESYTETPGASPRNFTINFEFTDRGSAVPLQVHFEALEDLTPVKFDINGRNARTAAIDEAVEVSTGKTRIREDNKTWREEPRPEKFFTIAGYAPATMQMLLVQYWKSHGSPAKLKTFPSGEVKIEQRGSDEIKVGEKTETLQRYTIEGLIWGRETLWFDSKLQLIAEISVDAEFDHFEAIREGYESALGTFVGRAGADEMAALSEIAKGISGVRSDSIAVVNGTLIDGTGKPPVSNATVVIENGKIVAAGPRTQIKIPKHAKIIDAAGKFILPGLWDMHAHFEQVEWGPIYLAAGATTVRDCGNELEFITAVRDAIANGRGLGPRILAAGIVDGDGPLALGVERVNNDEQAKEWVDRYHDLGFHQINHIQYVADIMRKPVPPNSKRVDRIEAAANIDLSSPESQRAIDFLKSHGTVIDPTLVVFESFTVGPDRPLASLEPGVTKVAPELAVQFAGGGVPPEFRDAIRRQFSKYVAIVGALHRAGIPIVAGTDQSVPGHSLYREMELYVEAGFTPMEAIQSATIVPARVMKQDAESGTIEPGKRADLILVEGNPLENIHNIRNVKTVITGGVAYNCAELWQSVGFKP
jgi:hypothetical protein